MKDIADDLLDDLEELEHSSNQLESSVENVIKNQETLDKLSGESAMESAVFMLEASKLAQDSAINSQLSAEVNLKLAKEQKIQIDELHEANSSWRQSMRNATQEIKGSRSFFITILVTAIITGIITSALVGGMLFTANQTNAQFKSDLIDLIQTETTLNHRQTTMKIDELASIIELLGNESGRKPLQFKDNEASQSQNAPALNNQLELKELHSDAIEKLTMAEIDYDRLQRLVTDALNEQKSVIANWVKQAPILSEKSAPETTTSPAKLADAPQLDLSKIEAHLAKIDAQLKNQLSQLIAINKQLENKTSNTPAAPVSSTIKTPATTESANDKRQLERDKAINSQLALMKKQLDLLQANQEEINKGLSHLTKELEKNRQVKEDANRPYSYRNPYEYKQ